MRTFNLGVPGWLFWFALVLGLGAGTSRGQQAPARFEVVVIRPTPPDVTNWRREFNPGLMKIENLSLSDIIEFAYGLKSDAQLLNSPGWADNTHYDIQGKEDPELAKTLEIVPLDQRIKLLQELVRGVLEERFHIQVHRKTLDVPIFALVVAKDGPKCKRANPADGRTFRGLVGPAGKLQARGATMQLLADHLADSREAGGRPVIDKTGLPGEYDWTLRWTPDGAAPAEDGAEAAPGLFTALQEQLGLRLVAQRGEVQGVVVDRVERPTEN